MIRSLDGIAPKIHATAFVSEAAYVVGDVTIGEGSSIWPGVVVRADAGKIAIGSELGYAEGVLHQGVQHAYQGIKNVLHHYQILPGEIKRIDPNREAPPKLVAAIHLDEYIPAPITGVFEPVFVLRLNKRWSMMDMLLC